jgi:hypothetical protein
MALPFENTYSLLASAQVINTHMAIFVYYVQAHYGVRVNEMIMCVSARLVRAGWLAAICSYVCVSIPLTFKSRQHDATIGSSRTYFLYFAEVINLEKQTPMKMCT